MIFDEAINLIKSEEGRKSLLDRYQEVFAKLDEYGSNFRQGVVDSSPDELDQTLQRITGYYTCLNSVSGALESYKITKGGAKHLTTEERETCLLFEKYSENADQMILVCQTLRKKFMKEWQRS